MRKVSYQEMSELRCVVCPKFIKLNVARRVKRRPLLCYRCHRATKRLRAQRGWL